MDKRTKTALEASIDKWDRLSRVRKLPEAPTDSNCPLCVEFINVSGEGGCCTGCPVKDATGEIMCRNTPYDTADALWESWRTCVSMGWLKNRKKRKKVAKEFRTTAKEELEFLKGLRDNANV